MNSADLIRFVENLPFEPFSAFVADGREIRIAHKETVTIGRHALSLRVVLESGQVEIVDSALVCSPRTVHPSSSFFLEQAPDE